jgi:murein DD-endopeptidase MepM/ murein hydrolase activator NlpD
LQREYSSPAENNSGVKGFAMKKQLMLFAIITSLAFAQQSQNERFIRVINRMIDAMNKQQYSAIVNDFNKDMQDALPIDKTTIFFQNLQDQYGKVLRADAPQRITASEMTVVLYFEHGTQNLDLYLDSHDKIAGFVVTTYTPPEKPRTEPPPQTTVQTAAPQTTAPTATITSQPIAAPVPAPTVPDKQRTVLLLPFKGQWVVSDGGQEKEGTVQNSILKQQYAYEFCALFETGDRYKKKGDYKEDYASFGKDVVAPADGTVVDAIDGIPDNEPGKRNPYALIGNAVFLQHSNGEVSVLAYLKQGSVKVKIGDKITRGQVIAQCGSSGGATEPALHYHLQTLTSLLNAKQVKFYFEHAAVSKDGKKETRNIYLPTMGDIVSAE